MTMMMMFSIDNPNNYGSVVKIPNLFETTLLNICLLVSLIILIILITYYIILLSDNEDYKEDNYKRILESVGEGNSQGNNKPVSRKIAKQAAINHARVAKNKPALNYKEFTHPSTSLNYEERILFANYLANARFSRNVFDIDRVNGNVTVKGTNDYIACTSFTFVNIWWAEIS